MYVNNASLHCSCASADRLNASERRSETFVTIQTREETRRTFANTRYVTPEIR